MTRTIGMPALLLAAQFIVGAAQAATVTASYSGVITGDSGLGLLGQQLRADLSYDDSVAGIESGNSFLYQDFLLSLVVTAGPYSWTYDAVDGSDAMFLYDDAVISFVIGVEDRVVLLADRFNGPDAGTGTVSPGTFSFDLYLSDNVPGTAPDGLTGASQLPAVAPVPELFTLSPGPSNNRMSFRWIVGDPEIGGQFYRIETSSVSTVPVPGAVWLLGSALAAGATVARRRRAA